ncbi:MAG: hypothetical protein HKN87_15985 [Saprospiraceae bacterium]|nr:hypothetical protein [Saprospiraceae bacterium]
MAAKILRTANDQGIIRRSLATTFVLEDVLRLVHLQDFSNDFVESLQINRQLFHRGAAFKLSDGKWSDLIEQTGLTWGNKDSRDDGQTLLALLGGASMYAPIDLHIPVASSEIEDLVPPLSDEHIYHDVWIMKEIQNADPSSSTISLSEQLDTDPADVAELFHLIRQRNLIRMHTIRPEFSDVETWLSQVLSLQHLLEEENERYARVYCNPISAGIDKEMITFYDREDPIIQLARGMQMSVTELQYDLSNAIEQAGAQSIYAQVLGHCMQRLEHWYTYLQGTLSKDSLVKKLSA